MRIQAHLRLKANLSTIGTHVMIQKALKVANERIHKLVEPARQLGISRGQIVHYIGQFLHNEILPGIEDGSYDGQTAETVLNSISAVQIAQHLNVDVQHRISPATIHKHGRCLALDPQERQKILRKLQLTPAEFHALSLMIKEEV
jgi:hypothetical protein